MLVFQFEVYSKVFMIDVSREEHLAFHSFKRYFIRFEEAASLCFKSLLNECKNHIVFLMFDQINHPKDIYELCLKILKKLNLNLR